MSDVANARQSSEERAVFYDASRRLEMTRGCVADVHSAEELEVRAYI